MDAKIIWYLYANKLKFDKNWSYVFLSELQFSNEMMRELIGKWGFREDYRMYS